MTNLKGLHEKLFQSPLNGLSAKDRMAHASAAVSSQFPGSRTLTPISTTNQRSGSETSIPQARIMTPANMIPDISMLAARKAIAQKQAAEEALQREQILERSRNSANANAQIQDMMAGMFQNAGLPGVNYSQGHFQTVPNRKAK